MAVVRDKRLRLHVRSGMHGSITESMLGRSYNMGQARRLALSLAPAPLWGASIKPPPLGVDIYSPVLGVTDMRQHDSIFDCSIDIIEDKFEKALVEFYQIDKLRLPNDLGERAILFRLGLHLHGVFENYDVFAEYNRDIKQPKRLPNRKLFIPDLVIMKPGDDSLDANLLAIEA